jgi:hypothetical protein
MADDPSKRGPQDRSRISSSEDYEIGDCLVGLTLGQVRNS